MKLGTRIFMSFLIIFGISFYYPLNWVLETLKTRYLEGVEEPLVDQANILASIVGSDMENERFSTSNLHQVFDHVYQRDLSAKIYRLNKTRVDMRIYITDLNGQVVFDSENPDHEKEDYSGWRDVSLTLQGQYGARTSPDYDHDPNSSVLYVAAPIYVNKELAGVLTVGKPAVNINRFLESARPQIIKTGILSLGAALLLCYLAIMWLTRPIKLLTRYANDVRDKKRSVLPGLGKSEINEMGLAFEEMRQALEGKKYVEQYIQTFTHEIKSPLSAIKGAAELLEETMPREHRIRFLSNIRNETDRVQKIVDRMLELSVLENRQTLNKKETFLLKPFLESLVEGLNPVLVQKKLIVSTQLSETVAMEGDSFLIKQAVSNLVQNAVDFSPCEETISLTASLLDENTVQLTVEDNGPGIPDFAFKKIFNRFFSLRRLDNGRKSTGLGLNFVSEVAVLHQGSITLENRKGGRGTRALFTLPAARQHG